MFVKSANMVQHFSNRTHSYRHQQHQFHKIRKMVLPKLMWVKRAIHSAFRPTFFSIGVYIASGNWSHLSLVIYHVDKYIWQSSWASIMINGEQQAQFIWCVWGVTGVPEIQRMCSYYCAHTIVGLLRVSVEGRRYISNWRHAKLGFGAFGTTEAASDYILVCKKTCYEQLVSWQSETDIQWILKELGREVLVLMQQFWMLASPRG